MLFLTIFFNIHSGTKLKAEIAQGCYACKKELSEHQITETNLYLSDNVKSVRLQIKIQKLVSN